MQEGTYLSTGMEFTMDFFQTLTVYMSVYLGGADIGMPQEFLDNSEISSLTEDVGGE